MTNHSYLATFEYFATGEGLTHILAHVIAPNEDTATRTVVAKYLGDDERTIEYFCRGVQVIDFQDTANHAKAREWLGVFFNDRWIEHVLRAETAQALHEFYMKTYVNYS